MKKLLITSILLIFLTTPLTAFALIVDPIGDETGSYDVTMMNALFDTNYLYIEAQFLGDVIPHGAGEITPGALYGYIDIDIDQNFFTGDISYIDFWGGYSDLGVEYMIDLFSLKLVNTSTFEETDFEITWGANSILATISLTDLGNDDGYVSYAGIFGDDMILDSDFIPDLGHGTSAPVPEPATIILFSSGLTGLMGLRRKFKRKDIRGG